MLVFANSASAQTYKYKYVYTETGNGSRIQMGAVIGWFNDHITFTQNKRYFYTSNANGIGSQHGASFSMAGSNPPKYRYSPENNLDVAAQDLWNNATDQTKGYHMTGVVMFTDSYNYMLVCLSDGGKDVYERVY